MSPAGGRAPAILAGLVCAAWFAAALLGTAGTPVLPPDTAHHAGIARNLVRGLGYTEDLVPFHFGWFESIRHAPEWHGILRPFELAGLFAFFGEEESLVRVPSLAWAAATGAAAFVLARSQFGGWVGLVACLLTLSSQTLFFMGWLGSDDTAFAFFFLLTLHFALRGLEGGAGLLALSGCAAGLALLEKQTGLYLAGVLAVTLWLDRGRRRLPLAAVCLFGPWSAAVAAYAWRNFEAYGGLAFRLGPLAWLYKSGGINAAFALYERPPVLSEVLGALGPSGVATLALRELSRFLANVFDPRVVGGPIGSLRLLAFGLPSLFLHLGRRPAFAWLSLAAAGGAIAFVCILYNFEPRYLLMLIPLSAVSLAGLLAHAWDGVGAGRVRTGLRAAALAAAGGVALYALVFGVRLAEGRQRLGFGAMHFCPQAVAWVRREVPPGEALLTQNPWSVWWATDHPAVLAPTGGRENVARVASRYGVRWVLLVPTVWRPLDASLIRILQQPDATLPTERPFSAQGCTVYRIR